MNRKETLLAVLESNRGRSCSGEELASALGVSRAAVWKIVEQLRANGYPIAAAPNCGYCLDASADVVSAPGARKYLNDSRADLPLEVLLETESTNDVARIRAQDGAPEGWTTIANSQTRGRGRWGRSFFSPKDSGVYFSLVLRPSSRSSDFGFATTTQAAVAACRAIERASTRQAEIKWVNDVFVGGRKVCGILTEAAIGLEAGAIEYAILGVGFIVYPPSGGFPSELSSIAGSIFDGPFPDGKNRLVGEFLNEFFALYDGSEAFAHAEEYRRRCFSIGRSARIVSGAFERTARVLDVDSSCRLVVEYEDGTRAALSSGEISVKPD